LALAIQLVLAFGHVHADALTGDHRASVATVAQPSGPDGDDRHDDHADKFCDICATIHALGSSPLPQPPMLAAPAAFRVAPSPMRATGARALPTRAAFHPRAPPTP
jgi:hypothetical protein